MVNLFILRSIVEIERHRRIMLSIWAYAYEFDNVSIVTDETFDKESRKVNLSIITGRLDGFFQKEFNPSTGLWIRNHPELDKVRQYYERYFR